MDGCSVGSAAEDEEEDEVGRFRAYNSLEEATLRECAPASGQVVAGAEAVAAAAYQHLMQPPKGLSVKR